MTIRKGFYEDGHFDSKVNGEYVTYEDYAELERKLRNFAAELAYRDWIIDEQQKELRKYKDQFPDYVECANCVSVTHVEGVE